MASSEMLSRVYIESTYVSEELSASIIRVTRIGSSILVTLMVELRNVAPYKTHTA
jgi:hypothetical protein